MAITVSDIKLLASERLNDDPDGGGYMTGTVVVDGVENNLFPDVSELDRTTGAVDMRKVFPAVITPTQDVYYGAHLMLDSIPLDPAISALLVQAASVSEVKSGLVARMNGTLQGVGPYYGTKALTVAGASADRVVQTDSIYNQLIPVSNVGSAVSGSVAVQSGTGVNGVALIAASTDASLELILGNIGIRQRFMPGTVTGTVTDNVDTAAALTDVNRLGFRALHQGTITSAAVSGEGTYALHLYAGYTAVSGTYRPGFRLTRPTEVYEFVWTSAMTAIHTINLPHLSEVGSEAIYWTGDLTSVNKQELLENEGGVEFAHRLDPSSVFNSSATVDRSTGAITALFDPMPKVGTTVQVYYVRAGYARALASSALSGAFASNHVVVTPSSGWALAQAVFRIGTNWFKVYEDGILRTYGTPVSPTPNPGSVAGSYDKATGYLSMIVANGTTIDAWYAAEVKIDVPATDIHGGTIPPNLDPASVTLSGTKISGGAAWSATANSAGAFSTALVTGTYSKLTGALSLAFTEEVSTAIAYVGTQNEFTTSPDSVTGLVAANYPVNGQVPVFRQSDVVVIHNTQTTDPFTATAAMDVNLGRTRVAEARVFGNNGVEITTGFAVNKTTGHVVFSSVTGYSQPVTIRHRVEDMATIVKLTTAGAMTLSRALSHAFPANTSFISSALVIGDMQARVRDGFAQTTWTNVWSDGLIGSSPVAQYNQITNPIVTTNSGAITERWAVIFTNTSTFRVVGEQVGELISNGSTVNPTAPVNPATGLPYFSIPAAGWGSGWAAGNVFRFNTSGASAPVWVLRSIAPSDPFVGQDSVTLAVRGDIDA